MEGPGGGEAYCELLVWNTAVTERMACVLHRLMSRDEAIDSFIQAITVQWRGEAHPNAVTTDILTLGSALLAGPSADPDSAFDLSTFALELAPDASSPQHEDALLLRGVCRS